MPAFLFLNKKHGDASMLSNPFSLLLLAHMLVSFFVSASIPLLKDVQTSPRVEALVMPESEIKRKYRESVETWKNLNHKHNVLRGHNTFIRNLKSTADDEVKKKQAEKMTAAFADQWPDGVPSQISETMPTRNEDGFVIVDPETAAAEADELSKAYAEARNKKAATTVPETIETLEKDEFEILYNAKRFARSWVERNKAIQRGDFQKDNEWTKKAANALNRNYILQMKEPKTLPNPYDKKEYLDIMEELVRDGKRHRIFEPTSQNLRSILKTIDEHRAAGISFEAGVELEKQMRESLDNDDIIGSLKLLRDWTEKVYPEKPMPYGRVKE